MSATFSDVSPCEDRVARAAQASCALSRKGKESSSLVAESKVLSWVPLTLIGQPLVRCLAPTSQRMWLPGCHSPDVMPLLGLKAVSAPLESCGLTGKEYIYERKPSAILALNETDIGSSRSHNFSLHLGTCCSWACHFKILAQHCSLQGIFPHSVIGDRNEQLDACVWQEKFTYWNNL